MRTGQTEDPPVGRFAAGLVVERRWRSDNGGSGGTLTMIALQKGGGEPIQPAPEELRRGGRRSEKEQRERKEQK